jgi:RimJ/RimL family protein N-acetyltransferase
MTLLEPTPTEAVRKASAPVLQTARLVLRAPRSDDASPIAQLANDLRVAAMTARLPHPYSEADAEQFIAQAGPSTFTVTLADGAPIGVCGIDCSRGERPELGYWLAARYWGHGYATEAARAVIDHAFDDPAVEALVAGARVSNPASRRVLEKCGFQWTGVELRRIRAIASSAPVDRFRLDRGLWASLKSWGAVQRVA